MRTTSRKGWVKKLDKICGDIVKQRDGKCVICGTTQNLTSGHLFSRIAYSTRWDLDNLYCQCAGCNLRHESDPYPFIEVVKSMHSPPYEAGCIFVDELHRKYVTPHKFKTFELEELYHELEKQLDSFEQHDLSVEQEKA